jgi:hypothetical protein
MGVAASSRDLTRAIEESIADSLIHAKEKGATAVSLIQRDDGVVAEAADPSANSIGAARA